MVLVRAGGEDVRDEVQLLQALRLALVRGRLAGEPVPVGGEDGRAGQVVGDATRDGESEI